MFFLIAHRDSSIRRSDADGCSAELIEGNKADMMQKHLKTRVLLPLATDNSKKVHFVGAKLFRVLKDAGCQRNHLELKARALGE